MFKKETFEKHLIVLICSKTGMFYPFKKFTALQIEGIFFCKKLVLFVLMLYVPVNSFQSFWDDFLSSWVEPVLSRG